MKLQLLPQIMMKKVLLKKAKKIKTKKKKEKSKIIVLVDLHHPEHQKLNLAKYQKQTICQNKKVIMKQLKLNRIIKIVNLIPFHIKKHWKKTKGIVGYFIYHL